jgi:hypothetical protein
MTTLLCILFKKDIGFQETKQGNTEKQRKKKRKICRYKVKSLLFLQDLQISLLRNTVTQLQVFFPLSQHACSRLETFFQHPTIPATVLTCL